MHDLKAVFEQVVATGRSAWPAVRVDPADIQPVVLGHLDGQDACHPAHFADLYLAAACAIGDTSALQQLEATFLPTLDSALRGLVGAGRLDDVKQLVRERLLVSTSSRPARIASYGGRGSLRAWLRASAVRVACRYLERERPEPGDLEWLRGRVDLDEPELLHLRDRYAPAFKRALEHAVATLSSRDRLLLRYAYIDAMSVDELGQLFRVHKTTAFRWLVATRKRVFSRTRRALLEELGVTRSEANSLIRLIRSHVELSLEQLLARQEAAESDAEDGDGPA